MGGSSRVSGAIGSTGAVVVSVMDQLSNAEVLTL
jgi:hypothetical protein